MSASRGSGGRRNDHREGGFVLAESVGDGGAVGNTEFAQGRSDVVLDRTSGQHETLGDLDIGESFGGQLGDFVFAFSERVGAVVESGQLGAGSGGEQRGMDAFALM